MLELGKKVMNGRYQIASMPYVDKPEAYEDIRAYWQGANVTTYYEKEEDAWYIVTPA